MAAAVGIRARDVCDASVSGPRHWEIKTAKMEKSLKTRGKVFAASPRIFLANQDRHLLYLLDFAGLRLLLISGINFL